MNKIKEDLNKWRTILCSWIGKQYFYGIHSFQSGLYIQHNPSQHCCSQSLENRLEGGQRGCEESRRRSPAESWRYVWTRMAVLGVDVGKKGGSERHWKWDQQDVVMAGSAEWRRGRSPGWYTPWILLPRLCDQEPGSVGEGQVRGHHQWPRLCAACTSDQQPVCIGTGSGKGETETAVFLQVLRALPLPSPWKVTTGG